MGQKIDQLPFLTSTEIPYQLGGWVAGNKLNPLEATKHTLNRCIYIQKHLQLQYIAVHHRIQHTHTLLSLCKMLMHTLHNCLQTFEFHHSSRAAFFLMNPCYYMLNVPGFESPLHSPQEIQVDQTACPLVGSGILNPWIILKTSKDHPLVLDFQWKSHVLQCFPLFSTLAFPPCLTTPVKVFRSGEDLIMRGLIKWGTWRFFVGIARRMGFGDPSDSWYKVVDVFIKHV